MFVVVVMITSCVDYVTAKNNIENEIQEYYMMTFLGRMHPCHHGLSVNCIYYHVHHVSQVFHFH